MTPITNVRELVIIVRGPLATAYCCPYCHYTRLVKKGVYGRAAGMGRGYGLSQGSTNHAAIVAHMKASHAGMLASGVHPDRIPRA